MTAAVMLQLLPECPCRRLREFTPWRLEAREAVTHLGAKPTKR